MTIDLINIKNGAVAALEKVFFAHASGPFRPCVQEFFSALATIFELEAVRRVAAPGLKVGKTEVDLPGLADFTSAELNVFKRAFMQWRNDFTKLDPAVAEIFNELAILLDDQLHDIRRNGKMLQMLYDGAAKDNDASWEVEL